VFPCRFANPTHGVTLLGVTAEGLAVSLARVHRVRSPKNVAITPEMPLLFFRISLCFPVADRIFVDNEDRQISVKCRDNFSSCHLGLAMTRRQSAGFVMFAIGATLMVLAITLAISR
jgi:hypothetical protein